jgi:hypothetical protein
LLMFVYVCVRGRYMFKECKGEFEW